MAFNIISLSMGFFLLLLSPLPPLMLLMPNILFSFWLATINFSFEIWFDRRNLLFFFSFRPLRKTEESKPTIFDFNPITSTSTSLNRWTVVFVDPRKSSISHESDSWWKRHQSKWRLNCGGRELPSSKTPQPFSSTNAMRAHRAEAMCLSRGLIPLVGWWRTKKKSWSTTTHSNTPYCEWCNPDWLGSSRFYSHFNFRWSSSPCLPLPLLRSASCTISFHYPLVSIIIHS